MTVPQEIFKKWLLVVLLMILLGQVALTMAQNRSLFGALGTDTKLTPAFGTNRTASIQVNDENGTALTHLTIDDFSVSPSTGSGTLSSVNQSSGLYTLYFSADDTYTVTVAPSGYVSESVSKKAFSGSSYPASTVTLDYGHKVIVIDKVTGNPITGASVSGGSGSYSACTELSGGEYGCVFDPSFFVTFSYSVSKSGYTTTTGSFGKTRNSNSSAAVVVSVELSATVTTSNPDTDGDGLTDSEENSLGTSPTNPDTDGDHLLDGTEVDTGTNPLDSDSDNGGVNDGEEVANGTNPLDGTDDYQSSGSTSTTFSCRELNISPDTVNISSSDGVEDVYFTVTVDSVATEAFLFNLKNFMAFALSEDPSTWTGIVELSTSGRGTFSNDVNGNTGSNILVAIDGESTTFNVVYENGAANDVITASVQDEESTCLDNLTLTESSSSTSGGTSGPSSSAGTPNTSGGISGSSSVTTDSDNDGLTDSEEATLGTSPTDSDSDDDGLNDGQEIHTYKTNPLDPDSDNGGISDGTEVYNRTNPLDRSDDQNLRDDIIAAESCEDPFLDTIGHWGEDLICRLYASEIVVGRSSILYVPDDSVTNAEWLKIILLNSGLTIDDAYGLKEGFYDVVSSDWYYPYVALGESLDVIRTRDFGPTFNPNSPISRANAVLWAVRLAGKTSYNYDLDFRDVDEDAYYAYALYIAAEAVADVPNEGEENVIEGYSDGTFRPDNPISRAEAAAVAIRIHQAWYSDED